MLLSLLRNFCFTAQQSFKGIIKSFIIDSPSNLYGVLSSVNMKEVVLFCPYAPVLFLLYGQ